MAEEKLLALEERLRVLAGLRDALKGTLRAWDEQLAQTPAGERALLLEGLEVTTTCDGNEPSTQAKGFPNERSGFRPRGSRRRDAASHHDGCSGGSRASGAAQRPEE